MTFLTRNRQLHGKRHQEWYNAEWQVRNVSVYITIFFSFEEGAGRAPKRQLVKNKIVIKTLTFLICHPPLHHSWWRSRCNWEWQVRNVNVIITIFFSLEEGAKRAPKRQRLKKKLLLKHWHSWPVTLHSTIPDGARSRMEGDRSRMSVF